MEGIPAADCLLPSVIIFPTSSPCKYYLIFPGCCDISVSPTNQSLAWPRCHPPLRWGPETQAVCCGQGHHRVLSARVKAAEPGSSPEPPVNPGGNMVPSSLQSPAAHGPASPQSSPRLAQAGFVFIKTLLDPSMSSVSKGSFSLPPWAPAVDWPPC